MIHLAFWCVPRWGRIAPHTVTPANRVENVLNKKLGNPYRAESAARPGVLGGPGEGFPGGSSVGFTCGFLVVAGLACALEVGEVVSAAGLHGFDVVDGDSGGGASWAADDASVVVALECECALLFPCAGAGADAGCGAGAGFPADVVVAVAGAAWDECGAGVVSTWFRGSGHWVVPLGSGVRAVLLCWSSGGVVRCARRGGVVSGVGCRGGG